MRRLHVTPAPADASVAHELSAIEAVAAAVESGAGLPEVVRAAGRALDASLALLNASGTPLAVDPTSPAEERLLLNGGTGVEDLELRVAGDPVGRLRLRPRAAPPPAALVTLVRTLLASEAERVRAPERASEQAVSDFVQAPLERRYGTRDELLAAGAKLGLALESGGSIVVAHVQPLAPTDGDWRRRVLAVVERGARAALPEALAALAERTDARQNGTNKKRCAYNVAVGSIPAGICMTSTSCDPGCVEPSARLSHAACAAGT
ncbi:MAG: hypothetical protein DLM61_23400, partial [Pseudonocardiales bacterium]